MKTILTFLICIILFFSCSKKNETTSNTNPPVVPSSLVQDTLSTGWTVHPGKFADIYFTNNLAGYAVGSHVSKTIDGGNTWSIINPDNSFFNVNCSPNGNAFFVGGMSRLVSTSDGGITFDTSHPLNQCMDVFFADNNNGYTIGLSGLSHTSDGGATWNLVQPITGLRFNPDYSSLFFINTNGWIIMDSSIFRTNGSINNWAEAAFDVQPSSGFTSIYAPSTNIIYACTDMGQVYKSTDGGVNFSLLTTFSQAFVDIHFIDDNTGYVCCSKKIFKTSDGGVTWQTVVSMATKQFIEINFTDANHGWACGDTLLIFKQ